MIDTLKIYSHAIHSDAIKTEENASNHFLKIHFFSGL